MLVHSCDSFVRTRLQQLASDDLFHSQDHAIPTANADCGATVFNGFCCVLNLHHPVRDRKGTSFNAESGRLRAYLEIPAVWREDRI